MPDLTPEWPEEASVTDRDVDVSHLEGAELLANEARQRLGAAGFTDEEIDAWAKAYEAAERTGDVDSFVAWIADQEASGGPA
jgi:hypothetical protein